MKRIFGAFLCAVLLFLAGGLKSVLAVSLPDLTIDYFTASLYYSSSERTTNCCYQVRVRNSGTAVAGSSILMVNALMNGDPLWEAYLSVGSLAPGASRQFSGVMKSTAVYSDLTKKSGTWALAVADRRKQVVESDENNNSILLGSPLKVGSWCSVYAKPQEMLCSSKNGVQTCCQTVNGRRTCTSKIIPPPKEGSLNTSYE